MDDLTLAEAIDLPSNVVSVPETERAMPDMYHARTGHVLPIERSNVYKQLKTTLEYADQNEMKISFNKTNAMVFNPCTTLDFLLETVLDKN